jgi:hypothetical protein
MKFKEKLLILTLSFLTGTQVSADSINYYVDIPKRYDPSPSRAECYVQTVLEIQNVGKQAAAGNQCTITTAMFQLSDFAIAADLIKQKKANPHTLNVHLLLNKPKGVHKSYEQVMNSIKTELEQVGIKVIYFAAGKGILHNKFTVLKCQKPPVDESDQKLHISATSISGSYNWTPAAREVNFEDCIVLKTDNLLAPTPISKAIQELESIFKKIEGYLKISSDDKENIEALSE